MSESDELSIEDVYNFAVTHYKWANILKIENKGDRELYVDFLPFPTKRKPVLFQVVPAKSTMIMEDFRSSVSQLIFRYRERST